MSSFLVNQYLLSSGEGSSFNLFPPLGFGLRKFKEELDNLKNEDNRTSDESGQSFNVYWSAPELFGETSVCTQQCDAYGYFLILLQS